MSAGTDMEQLSATVVRLGFMLGALDARSRRVIRGLLHDLTETPDDRQDIANRIVANARVSNKLLDEMIKGPRPALTTQGGRTS
jgi:hypothetical protein